MTSATLGRFLVREFTPWDGPALFVLTGDPVVMKYMGFRLHDTVAQAEQLIRTYAASPSTFRAISAADNPANILGVLGLEARNFQVTITLMFKRSREARGAGREFGTPLLEWIFSHPQVWRMWSYVHVDNIAGQRVTERLGALKEGRIRRFEMFPNISDEPQDVYMYSIVRG